MLGALGLERRLYAALVLVVLSRRGCALDQAVMEAELIEFGHGLFGVIKGLFLSAFQKLGALRIKGFQFL